ncbi:hypothetical protein HNE_0587 [Hyphomonas neptunium ATCC 15444]|uniref:Uncharacterized protein n=1 Tax=Hyphomonas neptunium (strain ATCC 15444) TaxID=228405 RepID=Q0C4M7_HYPNA|nr:hypothetical protein HNE_0587 [Hyphomonas neptunium ATCC 15444]
MKLRKVKTQVSRNTDANLARKSGAAAIIWPIGSSSSPITIRTTRITTAASAAKAAMKASAARHDFRRTGAILAGFKVQVFTSNSRS